MTALLGARDFAEADGLRRAHFPPARNQLRAHLTLFHHLAPALESEVRTRLKAATREPAPPARLAGLINLGGGVAWRIESGALSAIRDSLAEAFRECLIPQDRAPWRPHVTLQNKVPAAEARQLHAQLDGELVPRPLEIAGLALFSYLGGPWESRGAWRFGSGHAMSPPASLPR